MRLALFATCAVLVCASASTAQSAKDVNVTNFPDPQNVSGSVEVTNDAASSVEVSGEVAV
jgi:hypothetical protein